MISKALDDVNIIAERALPSPEDLKNRIPLSAAAEKCVTGARDAIRQILDGTDRRKFLVIGPCSIHDPDSAREFGQRLKVLSGKVEKEFVLVMRAYFEKPRTVTGWKGFINDPFLDDSFSVEEGLRLSRELLIELGEMGVPVGTEALDPIIPQYLADVVAWSAIGARTTESQTHRELASGLSTPVGFKNGTDGSIETAVNAIRSAQSPHNFMGITQQGQCAVLQTRGNRYTHIVLRGGFKPNYDADSIALCEFLLNRAGLKPNIVIDCSHGNSLKDPARQPVVFRDCLKQISKGGNTSIVGFMMESNIRGGKQDIPDDPSKLEYGVSITDACLDWETTERLILEAFDQLQAVSK